MRTKLNIDDKLLKMASEMTGINDKSLLVRLGLEALIARDSNKKLVELGGSERDLQNITRRRTAAR